MVDRNDVFNHIGDALHAALPEDGSAEVGMDHTKLFIRIGNQVFRVDVQAIDQINERPDALKQAQLFMSTLPYRWREAHK